MASSGEPPPPYSKTPPPDSYVRNGIPPAARRSMEDESRPLPEGWARQYDSKHSHQYFVDTRSDPPRSIWHHPFDDEQYLSTLGSAERERIQDMYKTPSRDDIEAESTDEEDHKGPSKSSGRPAPSGGASSSTGPEVQRPQKQSLGRKMKDKVTGSTHAERQQRRRQRAEEERKAYEQHQAFRIAMNRALETGQPQLVGRDSQGKDVYVEPPTGPRGPMAPFPGASPNSVRYNPYTSGVYQNPNARFYSPRGPYGRPYGNGFGGGYGLPLMGGLAGGLMFGGLLGAGI